MLLFSPFLHLVISNERFQAIFTMPPLGVNKGNFCAPFLNSLLSGELAELKVFAIFVLNRLQRTFLGNFIHAVFGINNGYF